MPVMAGYINGREYDETFPAKRIASLISNGVYNTELQVKQHTKMQIQVKSGRAWLEGYFFYSDTPITLNIPTAHGSLKRIDAIMLRFDKANYAFEPIVVAGVPSDSPVAPQITRDETSEIYDLKLAEIIVEAGVSEITQSNIRDTRLNTDECGIVHGLIEQIDTSQLMAQLESWSKEYTQNADQKFNDWYSKFKKSIDEIDGKLQECSEAAQSANEAANRVDESIQKAEEAAENAGEKASLANTAAQSAQEKAELAEEAAGKADTSAENADRATERANAAAESIEGLDVSQLQNDVSGLKEDVSGLQDHVKTNQTDISGLKTGKVDKVSGKGLSTNDFTTAYKTNLDNLTVKDVTSQFKVTGSYSSKVKITSVYQFGRLMILTGSLNDVPDGWLNETNIKITHRTSPSAYLPVVNTPVHLGSNNTGMNSGALTYQAGGGIYGYASGITGGSLDIQMIFIRKGT